MFIFAGLPRPTVAIDALTEKVNPPLLTANVVVAVLVLPAESVAVNVIVCVPTPTTVPANGLCVTVTAPQLSLNVAPATTFGIAAVPLSVATVVPAGAVNEGAVLSNTVTV